MRYYLTAAVAGAITVVALGWAVAFFMQGDVWGMVSALAVAVGMGWSAWELMWP